MPHYLFSKPKFPISDNGRIMIEMMDPETLLEYKAKVSQSKKAAREERRERRKQSDFSPQEHDADMKSFKKTFAFRSRSG